MFYAFHQLQTCEKGRLPFDCIFIPIQFYSIRAYCQNASHYTYIYHTKKSIFLQKVHTYTDYIDDNIEQCKIHYTYILRGA